MADAIVSWKLSDLHAGSSVALCPPNVPLDDGGTFTPSKAQQWLWQNFLDNRDEVARIRDEYNADLFITLNGDIKDGDHHNTAQLVSRNPATEAWILSEILNVPMGLDPTRVFVVRGTEAHVGKSGSGEETVARGLHDKGLPVVKDPDTDTFSWWHLRMEIQGVRYDIAHHGRTGYRPWTRANAASMYAAQIFYEYASRGEPHPHFAIRSHFHTWNDSYDAHPTRVIQLPAWQLATAYVHRKIPDAVADIGSLVQVIRDGAVVYEKKINFTPARGTVWRAA